MSTSTAVEIISTSVTDAGSILASGIPVVLGLAVVLLGVGYLWNVMRRRAGVGRRI